MSRKIFVFTPLPEDLLKHFLHMPMMGAFPIYFPAFPAVQEVCVRVIDVVRNTFSDIRSFVGRCQLTVTLCATPPQRSFAAAEQMLYLAKLIGNTVRGDEYAMTCCLAARNTRIPCYDRPLLFLRPSEKLSVVHATFIKDVMAKQSQPCCKPPNITSTMNFIARSLASGYEQRKPAAAMVLS